MVEVTVSVADDEQNIFEENSDRYVKFSKKTLQDYEVISVIGNGSFGTCYKVRDKESGDLYAWKGMDYDELSESQKESLVSEINVLRQLQHPNIVQYYHHLVNHEAKSIFIVMECCEGGDLAQLIAKARHEQKRFEEKYIWRVLFQVCKALQMCHNKIKEGTILHRDIKPANIFLDLEGNAKLGDFGLARMLRHNEYFAKSFVGTPAYMSPEIVKGTKYDRKSDVWAVGCLIYEMCALHPPFKGREFEQLSENIANGRFNKIPDLYSNDLHDIISFMLEVENKQRPNIEIITRHPIVVRNINDLGNEFPKLIEAEQDFYVEPAHNNNNVCCHLQYSPSAELSSTLFTEANNSFNEGYGQRRLSVSGVFTPDLRAELFYSVKRRIFAKSRILQQSDPELYESIKRNEYATVDYNATRELANGGNNKENSPSLVTQSIFDAALQKRLHAIRAQESLLKQKEQSLKEREQQLNEKEKRLQELEHNLHERTLMIALQTKNLSNLTNVEVSKLAATKITERTRMPLPEEVAPVVITKIPTQKHPPPIPPRSKPTKSSDDTYCTIEPNDTLSEGPTMAKLNMAALPAAKTFPTLRKVTFQSPKKIIRYDIENIPPPPLPPPAKTSNTNRANPKHSQTSHESNNMKASISSKGSDDSNESNNPPPTSKRKSILSIFGINRNSGSSSSSTTANKDTSKNATTTKANVTSTKATLKEPRSLLPKEDEILSKCETAELSNIWTKENKRAAFDLLAALNAASVIERDSESNTIKNSTFQHRTVIQQQQQLHHYQHKEQQQQHDYTSATRHKFRQSVRERNSSLQRNRMRRSLIEPPTTTKTTTTTQSSLTVSNNREQILI